MIERIGRFAVGNFRWATDVVTLCALALGSLVPRRQGWREVRRVFVRQILFTGVDALPAVSVVALLIGLIIVIQAGVLLPAVGAGSYLYTVILLTVVHEVGPLGTAFIVIWRSGTAMAIELGQMQVSDEVESLEALGISVERFIVLPRVLAAVVAVVCLTVYFDSIAILGGFAVAKVKLTIPLLAYVEDVLTTLTVKELLVTPIKGSLFGLAIAAVACHHGLSVRGSTNEIPQQTSEAMLRTVTCCLAIDIIVSSFLLLRA